MRIKKHSCSLHLGSNSMLPIKENPTAWDTLTRNMRKWMIVSSYHPRSKYYFKSYPALVCERQRHRLYCDPSVIHPFSMFSFIWNSLMLVIYMVQFSIVPLRLCFVIDNIEDPQVHGLDCTLLTLQIISVLDIVVQFSTGYVQEQGREIVMDRRRLVCAYLKHFFLVDLAAALPLSFALLSLKYASGPALLAAHALPLVKIFRLADVLSKLSMLVEVIFKSYIWKRVFRHLVLFMLIIHWFTCSMYIVTIIRYYWTSIETVDYNEFLKLGQTPLSEVSFEKRYRKALFVSIATFLGTGFSMFKVIRPDEIVVSMIVILGSTIFMIYTVVLLLELYMTKYNSSTRYHEMMDQVEKYMRHKQFPAALKKRLLQFYDYRFQKHYFQEKNAIDSLSEHLRQEITLHTCRKLVESVAIFDGLPKSLVGTILGCLHPEVYLPNDLVMRAGDTGDSMYFIANGTVAVFTQKGVEVCHLEDGAHFGEVALLMKDMKRVATVVAIEITEVYRLDRTDYRRFVMTYSALYDRIEKIATTRMNETVLLDEAYRKEKEKRLLQSSKEDVEVPKLDTISMI